jgi:hypothetical protein
MRIRPLAWLFRLLAGLVLMGCAMESFAAEPVVRHAVGTFEIQATPLPADADAKGDAAAIARLRIAKQFSGDLVGTSTVMMSAYGQPKPGEAASYVAIELVHATLAGHSGDFVLLHRGMVTRAGEQTLEVMIAPDSGTGGLAGISGTLDIVVKAGVHHYDLAYRL